jgi:predicted site-specific integrase-resolvase
MPTTLAASTGLMTMAEYCAHIGISIRTGYQWAKDGKIPVRCYGKNIRVLPDALHGFEE